MDILFVCTGNICRSPMAEGLLRTLLAERGIPGTISSTGTCFIDRRASEHSVGSLRRRGIDISSHRSRIIDRDQVAAADLVLGMARSHLREAVLLDPPSFPHIFTLKELVRRGEQIGARLPIETVEQWLRRAGLGRRPADHLGSSWDDDVEDPYGQPSDMYEDTAKELENLLERLVPLLWPNSLLSIGVGQQSEARR